MKTFRDAALARTKPPVKPKLYSITSGTVYDIPGRLKRMARSIEAGDYGTVSDVVLILRYQDRGRLNNEGFHFGPGSMDVVQAMCSRTATRLTRYDA